MGETAYGTVDTVTEVAASDSVYGPHQRVQKGQAGVASSSKVVESTVRSYFSDIPVMAEIARCESQFRHTLSDGTVLRGTVDSRDVGVMQINTGYHADEAKKLGLNLLDMKDNMAFARYLYKEQGTAPWQASAKCWNPTLARL